jgi:hypothetical protein
MSAQIAQARHAQPWRRMNPAGRRGRTHHPLWRQGQRAVREPDRNMNDAAENSASTARGDRLTRERMKRVVDSLLARQNPGAMSLSRPARARRISPLRSASRRSSITASASGSSRPLSSSTPSNRRSFRESLGRSPGGSPIPTSSSSTNSATCRSAPPAERYSSICSASSTSEPASSSRPT